MNTTDTDLVTELFPNHSVSVFPAPVSRASLSQELDRIEDYFADQTLSKKTEKDRRYLLKRFLTWIHQEGTEHETVTVRQVKEWMDQHKWKNSLCVQTAVAIRLFSVWRFKENHPLAKLRIKREDPGEQRTLNKAEVNRLLDYLDKPTTFTRKEEAIAIRNMAIFSLAFEAGLRISELLRLGLQELSIEEQNVKVLENFARGMKCRQCAFSKVTAEWLRKWLAIRGDWAQKDCDKVFVGIKRDPGHPLTDSGMKQIINTLRRKTALINQTGVQRTLSEAEVKTLWTYGDNPTEDRRNEEARLRDRAILSVALDTGLRASELCHLETGRLSLEERRLQVMGKGGEWRKCVISEITVSRLREWLAIRGDVARKDCNTVFVGLEINIGGENTEAGKPMTRNSLFQVMQRLGKSTGMYLPVHSLRRTFATLAIRRGASTRLVQLQGGWKDIRLVQRYTQALTADDFVGYFPTEI